MKLSIASASAMLAVGFALSACGSPGATTGAVTGAAGGALVAGPPGAIVGAAAGATVGVIADDNAPRFRTYVVEQRHPSFAYSSDVAVGATLPNTVVLYDVPPDYNVATHKYAVVNDRVVLVEPGTYRVVQVF